MRKNNKINTLLVLSKFLPEYSGAAVRTKLLYKYLLEKNNFQRVEVICGSTEHIYPKKYIIDQFNVLRLPSYLPYGNTSVRIISQFILNIIYVIYLVPYVWKSKKVHIIGNDTVTVSTLFLAKLFRKKIIYEAVTQKARAYQRIFGLFKIYFPKTTTLIAISEGIAQRVKSDKFFGEVWSRPNPINLKNFRPKTRAQKLNFKSKLLIAQDKKVLMFIGKFMPGKRQDLLLEVINELPENYHLVLAGPMSLTGKYMARDAEFFRKLQLYINRQNLQNRVILIADYVHANEYIPYADYYLSFSDFEGLGNTVLEAVVSEVSVLASENVPSFCEHIGKLDGSFVLPPKPKAVANKILELEEDEQNLDKRKLDSLKVGNKVCHKAIYKIYENLLI